MKKYKQILAGLLAMNLAVYVMPTGMLQISASVQDQNNEDTDKEETETDITDSQQTQSAGIASETNVFEEGSSDNSTDISEDTTTDSASEAPENMITESTEESEGSSEIPDFTDASEKSESGEDVFSDGTQLETAAITSGEGVVTQAAESSNGNVIELKNLNGYDGTKNTFTVTNVKQLILLSYCNPEEIKDITINLQISGTMDITETQKIKQGDNLSGFFSNTMTVSADETLQEDAENADVSADSNNGQQEETSQDSTDVVQPENDSAEIAESVQTTGATDEKKTETPEQEEDTQDNNFEQSQDMQNDISAQAEKVTATQDYTFQGIGTESVPFQGTIVGLVTAIRIDHTFFGGLSSKATVSVNGDVLPLTWCGNETMAMVAGVYQFAPAENIADGESENNHTLPVKVTGDATGTMGSLIDTVQKTNTSTDTDQTLIIGDVADYSSAGQVNAVLSGNAGLICNTLKSGNISLRGYNFPQKVNTIQSTAEYNEKDQSAAGNAGGLIGVMKNNTTLKIESAVTIPDGIKITSDKGNAGGLVGLMEQNSKITIAKNAEITLKTPTIKAGVSAGGVVGTATDVTFTDSDLISAVTVDNPTVISTGTVDGATAGGFVGEYILEAEILGESAGNLQLSNQIVITTPTLTVSNNGLAGGYFGHLNLNGKVSYTIGSTDSNAKKEINPVYAKCSAEAAGAIAGKMTSDTIESTFQVQNMSVQATNSSDTGIQYHGGLVGKVGNKTDEIGAVYLKVSNVDIKVTNPYSTDEMGKGFGGITGFLTQDSILQTEKTITIDTNNTNINRGGGFVGYAEKSVINLSGKTDLSKVKYQEGSGRTAADKDVPKTGWLVGMQESALIYANGDGNGNGWSYIRGKENTSGKQSMNDIGNYGQIIRLHSGESGSKLSSDLITIDDKHIVVYKPETLVKLNGNKIVLESEDAFALLSIAWNSRGYFSGVDGITSDNFSTSTPKSKNITLSADIDLTGSGIAGLSRDSYSDDDTYSATFDGGNRRITLSIGEKFGYKQDFVTLAGENDYGYGEVISAGAYYHGRQGLFAKVANATIQNLTLGGVINVSNTEQDMLVGGIAGELSKNNTVTVCGVTAEQTINAVCNDKGGVMAGGFFGGAYEYGTKLQFGRLNDKVTLNTAAADINLKNCGTKTVDTKINAGEVIGEVGESAFTFTANCLDVKGSITTSVNKRAYVGGLIGIIKGSNNADQAKNHTIEIKGVTFDGFKINASNASDVCGGLFGSIWSTVGVYFMGESDTNNGTETKLTVKDATIDAPNATCVGGLAYRSSGNWEIRDHGIDLQKLSIHAKTNVGLLVCKGERNTDQVAGGNRYVGALYLSTTKYWDSSYKISQDGVSIETVNKGVFDEFVAYTTPNAKEIVDNKKNGVISIATNDNGKNGRVGVDVTKCTTYQNRTEYGKAHSTNAYSRYYYDLDQCLFDIAEGTDKTHNNNGMIDTPQELLLWSVYRYASENIKEFFTRTEINKCTLPDVTTQPKGMPWVIGGANSDNPVEMDMSEYSYYPVKVDGDSINVRNAKIIFNNEQIEGIEKKTNDKKSTQGITDGNHTQHYTMHAGLFLTYQSKNGTLRASDVTFLGSIGKVNNDSSGVIVSDFASGYLQNGTSTSSAIKINISNISLNGLKVNECNDNYAPLLINNIGSRASNSYTYGYTELTVDNIKIVADSYKNGQVVASSLIGKVGSDKAKEITMRFQNVALPDKKADGTDNGGIFSHATLLEQFAYDKDDTASDATYIFYSTDDWSKTEYTHNNVTYGKEITETTEYKDIQKWYYDEATWGTDDGLVYDDKNGQGKFSSKGYLPYVYTAFDSDQCLHEIKVNQRVVDITNGCGTYGHPYRITKEQEMNVLSEYMSTGSPRKDWRVTVTKAQNTAHAAKSNDDYTSDQDVTYQYDGNDWVQVVNKGDGVKDDWQEVTGSIKLGKEFMLNYLLNAYYDIHGTTVKGSDATTGDEDASAAENKLILTDFKGFGTSTNPFRGVITSKNGTTVVLKGAGTANGFIPYSYGSVVKNLKISYEETGKTLTYRETDTASAYYPGVNACFGGVIGCVLGGDNIIDDVTVSMDNNWLTLDGGKKHLIQVGGYVGSVTGGGVIFRNMENKSGLSDAKLSNGSNDISVGENAYYSLYVNPYVGRVLDGFAFYESNSKENTLNNTSKNYKINTLVTGDIDCVDITGNTVTVNNAQGLLVLSAIINSGAASNGISNAYSQKGRSIGQPVQYPNSDKTTAIYFFGGKYGKVRNASYNEIGAKCEDANLAENEEQKLPGSENLPYLIQKYCKNNPGIFSLSTNPATEINLSANGKFDMTGYENGYQGISARYVSNAIQGYVEADINVKNHPEAAIPELKRLNGNGNILTMNMQVREYVDDDFHVASVGGVFNVLRVSDNGTVSDLIIEKNDSNTKPEISLMYYDENGQPAEINNKWNSNKDVGIGGLAGSLVGYTDNNANRNITIEKIQLNGLTIVSPASAGGIIGNIGKPSENQGTKDNSTDMSVLLQPQNSQVAYGVAFNNCSYKDIIITGKYASGGFAGYIGNKEQNPRSSVNGNNFDQTTLARANMGENSLISATDNTSWAGGLFGYVETRMFINMTDEGIKKTTQAVLQDVSVSAGTAVGGCIGYIKEKCYGIHNVIVKGTEKKYSTLNILDKTSTGTFCAGGIIGWAHGAEQNWTPNWKYVGGISGSSIENVQINDENKSTVHNYSELEKIKTNYISGGIVGQVSGGKTRIEGCTVTGNLIYGSVASGIAGQTDSILQFINCKTEGDSEKNKTEIKGFSTAGGILGFWKNKVEVTIQGCEVQYLDIEGKDWGVGALIGDADGDGVGTLYLFDSSIKNSEINAAGDFNNGGGRWPCVGSIIGNLRNTIKASNVLVSAVKLVASDGANINNQVSKASKGLLFGKVNGKTVNIAGISIQKIPDDNNTFRLAGDNMNTSGSYIAFADYSGTASDTSTASQTVKDEDLLGYKNTEKDKVTTEVASPYVVTSLKNSTLKLYENESDAKPKYLYGDGVSWSNGDSASFTVKAQEIYKNRKSVTNDHYAYREIPKKTNADGAEIEFDFTSALSTFNTNNPTVNGTTNNTDKTTPTPSENADADQTTEKVTDFPVLQIGAGSADTVTDYLDILTNGAFSAANNLNKEGDIHVTAQSSIYEYKGGKFIKATDTKEKPAAFKVDTASNGKITFSTTANYDNTRNRFNLLAVTFTEKEADEKTEHHYNVFVPVLVRRMLEIDFKASLTYGTDFKNTDYDERTTHVLESFGSSITGYLTYTYNSAKGTYADYGWESYINAGGNVMEMKKSIRFEQSTALPEGTQLSLVDCRDGRVYYYTATGTENRDGSGINIPLSKFENSEGEAYQEPSISELIGAKAETTGNKLFVKVDANGKPIDTADETAKDYPEPTVKIGKDYYRLAVSDETPTYSITVNENSLKSGTKSNVKENYYLVITVPENASGLMNGSIQTKIESKIPKQINYRTIKLENNKFMEAEDGHSNTASTYLLSSGYKQVLNETGNRDINCKLSMSDSVMKVDVTDKITFPNSQVYNENDQLYIRFVGGLQKTMGSSTDETSQTAISSAEQFPSGTTGTANFYVYTEKNNTKTYYTYVDGLWNSSESQEQIAVSYPWISTGGNMELPLSTDGTTEHAISLQNLRNQLKDASDGTGDSTFYVQVKMNATIPGAGLDVIPESKTNDSGSPEDYVKLTYYSQLSTESQSLTYSSNRATLSQTKTAYYQEAPSGAKLTYDADKIDQLGINLLDLQSAYLDAEEKNTYIDTTATYDLSALKNLKDTLKNSTGIKFTLSLVPKNTTGRLEEYGSQLTDADKYLDVTLRSQDSGEAVCVDGTWSWTVPKASYYDDTSKQIITSSVFDGSKLRQAIRLKVNVTNVEDQSHFYSNYKVVLTAEIMNGDKPIADTHKDDNIIYTLAKINMEFQDQ